MFSKKKRREMRITCNRCAHVQYRPVPTKAIRKPSRIELAGARMQVAGNRMSLGGSRKQAGAEIMLARLEKQKADYERAVRGPVCDACGSQSIKSEVVEL